VPQFVASLFYAGIGGPDYQNRP